ncbi:chemotaxis-specific methylesterase CheB [Gottschalkia acidurici 9a]|uniref:Protein-glutamate methylesterase/protein-glutamine glutaminase n=1 Tax=Gottschalkia acidurici (strain ATCC 7906 / DSM 604 / BCRC 14475 / CIP 104303 / KCTC 5404 / NCIMB 10678 / 9a) TaxID=1128398 RepID=K0AZY9_GOTA9|nr:chemotaxis response regulator protein-glutamate methylesterase [Gottschalkia acidurici]AFS77916.1 chemotaxis-specific methylesterase CheB [Gottschalkia acidurici 9a]
MARKIKVLVVDDSFMFREVVSMGISQDPLIDVVATATDPYIARDKIIEFEPDVITLDIDMPRMNGIEFLKKLMPQYPIPVIVVSAIDSGVLDALRYGAIDFVTKSDINNRDYFISELIRKIKIASISKVGYPQEGYVNIESIYDTSNINKNMIIAIGASTGGTEAILKILKDFHKDIPGIVIVQHMPAKFTKMYADRINNICEIDIKEAEKGDIVTPGKALIAPGGYHMEVKKRGDKYIVDCFRDEKVNGHRPSVDVLFNSVADCFGKKAVGVILTGMGCDGSKGLLKMKESGAITIAQDEKTSVVYGMPRVAYQIGATTKVLPIHKISREVYKSVSK